MLTEKQQAILDFIQEYMEEHQYPPSVREIGSHFGVYPATVQDHISALERKGFLQKQRFQSRSLTVSLSSRKASRPGTPVLGKVAAGMPLLAEENVEDMIQLPEEWAAPGTFLLRVKGDSMVGAHILNGDYVLVDSKPTASDGEIVVALIGEEATVKRFYKTPRGITLKAENPKFDPIQVPANKTESFRILGRVVGVMRLMNKGKKKS
jgi:repressor LexA